jgi:hypothetical protein
VPPPGQEPPSSKMSSNMKMYYLLGSPFRLQSRQPKREWSITGLAFGCEKHSPSIPTAPLVSEEQLMRRFLLFNLTRQLCELSYLAQSQQFARGVLVASNLQTTPPTCLPCKVHSSICGSPSTCQLLLAGLFRVWPIERIRSCRIHTGTRIPHWVP